MSLVNDVLKQLDDRAPRQHMPGMMSVPSGAGNFPDRHFFFSDHDKIRRVIQLILLLIVSLLLWRYTPAMITAYQSAAENNQVVVTELPEILSDDLILSEEISSATVPSESEIIPSEIPESDIPESIEPQAKKQPAIVKANTSVATDNTPVATHNTSGTYMGSVSVTPRVVPGHQTYEAAIRTFRSGNQELALRQIDQAILQQDRPEYVDLKARILISQRDKQSFIALLQQYSLRRDLNWYALVAPGLQLFREYSSSGRYYKHLIEQQPSEIKWKLGAALNHERTGDVSAAISIYTGLLRSGNVSPVQNQWLKQQIIRLSDANIQ